MIERVNNNKLHRIMELNKVTNPIQSGHLPPSAPPAINQKSRSLTDWFVENQCMGSENMRKTFNSTHFAMTMGCNGIRRTGFLLLKKDVPTSYYQEAMSFLCHREKGEHQPLQ